MGEIMADKVETGAPEAAKLQMSRSELLERLRTLEENRNSVEQMKKNAAADYGEQIADLKGEIADVLAQLKNTLAEPVDG